MYFFYQNSCTVFIFNNLQTIKFFLFSACRQAVDEREFFQPLSQKANAAPQQPPPTSHVIKPRHDVIELQQAAVEELFLLPQKSRQARHTQRHYWLVAFFFLYYSDFCFFKDILAGVLLSA